MTELSYHPGAGTLLARDGAVLLVDTTVAGDELTTLWQGLSIDEPDRVETVLTCLVAHHGVRRLPGFGLFDPARGELVIRSGVRVLRAPEAEESDLEASHSVGWMATALNGTEVGLALSGDAARREPVIALPFLGGIAMAGQVNLETGGSKPEASSSANLGARSYMSLIVGHQAGESLRSTDETQIWRDEPLETSDTSAPTDGADHSFAPLRPHDEVVVLKGEATFGRAPMAPDGDGPIPQLVQLSAHGRLLSRTHLDVRPDGGSAFARAVGSTNGIEGTGPKREAEPPLPSDPRRLHHGSVVRLAGTYSFSFEDNRVAPPSADLLLCQAGR